MITKTELKKIAPIWRHLSLFILLGVISISQPVFCADPVYNLVASSEVTCDFRNLYEKQIHLCELALIYEPAAKTATLFLFKNRQDSEENYNAFLNDNSIGVVVKTFNLESVFGSTELILSFSALFQAEEKLKFQGRFDELGSHQEVRIIEY